MWVGKWDNCNSIINKIYLKKEEELLCDIHDRTKHHLSTTPLWTDVWLLLLFVGTKMMHVVRAEWPPRVYG